MSINDYDPIAGNNSTISGINIAEGCPPAGINDAIRQLMADLANNEAVRVHLSLVIGTDVQAHDPVLDDAAASAAIASFATNEPFALKSVTTFTTGSGTYTPTTGVRAIEVWCLGGGGGGGGCDGQGNGSGAAAGSGSAGGECYKFISSPAESYSYVVGAGGSGGAAGANNGLEGEDTTFTDGGSLNLTAPGGIRGTGNTGTTGSGGGAPAGSQATPTGGDLNITGAVAQRSRLDGGDIVNFPTGASSRWGAGGVTFNIASNGVNATGFGAGGGGATAQDQTNNRPGGAGSGGLIFIKEYF